MKTLPAVKKVRVDGQMTGLSTLSELVRQDLDEEAEVINDVGRSLLLKWIGFAVGGLGIWLVGFLFGNPMGVWDLILLVIAVILIPVIERGFHRYLVKAQLRYEREVRMEMKLNVLLGLVFIDNDPRV